MRSSLRFTDEVRPSQISSSVRRTMGGLAACSFEVARLTVSSHSWSASNFVQSARAASGLNVKPCSLAESTSGLNQRSASIPAFACGTRSRRRCRSSWGSTIEASETDSARRTSAGRVPRRRSISETMLSALELTLYLVSDADTLANDARCRRPVPADQRCMPRKLGGPSLSRIGDEGDGRRT